MNARYKELEPIYLVQTVRITRSLDLVTNKQVCVKAITVADFDDLSYLLKEIISLFTLNQKSYYVKILDYWLDGYNREVHQLNIVTEYFERGDLQKEITKRSKTSKPFTLDELKSHFKQLLAGFKELQEINFSHRDIKAENIFINSNGQLVIGDLGSASHKCESEMTLVGSPIYMSPEIRAGFDEFRSGHTGPRVNYDPFKSDVWSLGITFLHMIKLEKPNLINLSVIGELVNTELNKIQNELLKNLLGKMLKVDPNERDDFVTLYEWFVNEIEFNEMSSLPGPPIIKRPSSGGNNPFGGESLGCDVCCFVDKNIKCTKCTFSAHADCLEDVSTLCPRCGENLDYKDSTFKCEKCKKRFKGQSIKIECKHIFCFDCQAQHSNCHICLGFSLNSQKPESLDKLPILNCPHCSSTMVLKGKSLSCQTHRDYRICIVCKLSDHKGSCLSVNSSDTSYCFKCGNYTKRLPNSYMILCSHCSNNYCYICLKDSNEHSHLKCSNMFTWT